MAKVASGRFALICYILFLVVAALSGGTSLYYSPSQPVIRLAAIALVGALCLRSEQKMRGYHVAFWFLALLALLLLVQLVPLPPSLWSALPARDRYLEAAIAAGEPQPWRPINLTPDRGWNALFALLPPAAVLFVASRLRMRDQAAVVMAFLMIIMVSAVLGLAQVSVGGEDALHLYAGPSTGLAVGLFANRNHQALLIACGLPTLGAWVGNAYADLAKVRLRGVLAFASGSFLMLMIPLTGSRAGLGLAAVALPFGIILAQPAMKASTVGYLSGRQRVAAIGCAVAAFATLIGTALTFSRAESVRRLFESGPIDDARYRLLGPLIGMIRDFWPVGSGFGSFDPVYRGSEPFENLALTVMNQAHNDFLQVVMEAGLPGLLLLIVFAFWWGWTSFRLWRREDSDSTTLGRLGSVILLLIMLASVIDYPVRMPLVMVIAAQSAAWMLLPRTRVYQSPSSS